MTRPAIDTPVRGLKRPEAARYIGVCPTTFDGLVSEGKMPQPVRIGRRVIWDKWDLDTAFEQLKAGSDIDEEQWANA